MPKRILVVAMALAALPFLLVSCLSEDSWQGRPAVPDGYVSISFSADVPAMQEVVTRAVDYDGGGVQNMTLFCFDSYGLFISTVSASLSPKSQQSGTFTATIPESTRTIHFVANQNMTGFDEDNFHSKSESEVMALLEGSSGRMIYWARFACNDGDDSPIASQIKANGAITMIRNHALVSIEKESDSVDFEISGFVVCNTSAFGTVAPFHPDLGFDFEWPGDEDFVTLPLNQAKMSDINDVTTDLSQYVFETENSPDDPVSVIVKGHSSGDPDLYYRVLLIDDEGNQLLVRRNHHYILNIQGPLSYGQASFADALTAPATNNVWISISDDVNEVRNNEYVLSVKQTAYVLDETYAGDAFTIEYSLSRVDGNAVASGDRPEVSWLYNNVAAYAFDHVFTSGTAGQGSVTLHLNQLGGNEEMLEGSLLIKKGKLQRTVKIILIKQQKFFPSWVSTQVYTGGSPDDLNSANVTAVFSIPETCPAELFPLNVYISVDELDVRSESGMKLDVVTSGSEGYYGEDNGIGYKYVYVAEGPGVQRVYFKNKLYQEADHEGKIIFEAPYFETLTKTFNYSERLYAITVSGLSEYNTSSNPLPGYAEDETIYYRLVPQKRYADVQFDMVMKDLSTGNNFDVQGSDEFLLYSGNLDYYRDGETTAGGIWEFDCTFGDVGASSGVPASDGRVLAFKPRNPGSSEYSIYMKTNCPVSAEVVRISSNQADYDSMFGNGKYSGNMYRSVIFELANYRPFRFAAQINGYGNTDPEADGEEETVDNLSWTYEPGQKVDIEMDITSFAGADGRSVDPFGEEFEIYIDAPMLSIDESRLASCNLADGKLVADPSVPGRFVYTVASTREAERAFGTGDALKKDATAGSVDQTGERKTLPFVTGTPVSAGDIVISSNLEKVVFYTKTFTVTNESIQGTMKYGSSPDNMQPVPEDAFVPFELVRNNSRIGSVSVGAGGSYELRLRKEYQFNWYSDSIQLLYENNGIRYTASYQSLSALFANPDMELTESVQGG